MGFNASVNQVWLDGNHVSACEHTMKTTTVISHMVRVLHNISSLPRAIGVHYHVPLC